MNKLATIFIVFLGLAVPVFFISAVGNITGYAWSNNSGWVNFGCDNCTVSVSSTTITGYAWSENYGWINFNPDHGGVLNDGIGNLSGSAWGQNAGWIDFSNVKINSEGQLTGTATGDIVGTIAFTNCGTSCGVTTDWRSSGSTPVCGDGTCNGSETCSTCPADCTTGCGGGGGGGGGSGGSYSKCDAQTHKCVSITGSGTNQCSGDSDCAVHNQCDATTHQCISVAGAGTDGCQTSDDCAVHNECNSQKQCVQITGKAAPSQCTLGQDSDCATIHTICDGTDVICRYDICTGMKCVESVGPGLDQCTFGDDSTCTGPVHNICNANNQCALADGAGTNSCLADTDCSHTYSVCNNGACVPVNGIGLSQCAINSDCPPPPPVSHNECNDSGQCVQVSGSGDDSCKIDTDCPVPQHTECQNSKCVSVIGAGVNQCTVGTDSACLVSTHNECNSQKQCVLVNGAGQNGCQTDLDCNVPSHRECNDQKQCVSVIGSGSDQCGTASDCEAVTPGGFTTNMHSECNSQNQCVSVNGIGPDKCQSSSDCAPKSVPAKIIQSISETIQNQIPEPVKAVAVQTKKIIESAQGSIATKTVSTAGLAVATVAETGSLLSFSFFEIFLIPLRLFGLLLEAFGLKKRRLPWGVVYDSVTKRPIDPVYVMLKNIQTGKISSAITDMDGRYGFLVDPGVYQMQAKKTNYIFPSQKLYGKVNDELYSGLYFGENIEIKTKGEVIAKNIPLDPVKFDWNEFAKQDKGLMKFYSKWEIILRKIYDALFDLGFIVAVIAYIFAPYPYNAAIILLYVFLLVLRIFGVKPKTYGYVTDKITGAPLSFAIIRVIISGSEIEIASKSVDKYGKYYCLVPPGKYYVKIERKNDDESYSLVYTSPVMDVSHKGIIKENFKI